MKRTKLKDRELSVYSRGEEIFNMVSHIVGGALGVVALVLCVVFASIHKDPYAIVSGAIYGTSLIILYTMSSIYHGLNPKRLSKKVFQILDHCAIFMLIAGCYTPISLCSLREHNTALGWTIFGIIWGMAIVGIVFNSIDLKRYKVLSMICYLAMGWCAIFTGKLLPKLLGTGGFWLLIAGGICYTIGACLYGIGKKKKWMHSIFHVACFFGSLLQFFCIFFYIM